MTLSTASMPPDGCPASAVVMAARLARTPLAVADARSPDAPLMFANAAFADLLGCDAATLVGRPLRALANAAIPHQGTVRFDLEAAPGHAFAAALSTAPVDGPDGVAFCLLCSLVDARGDGADAAIARDAALLAEVARAAGDLMRESAQAARVHPGNTASHIALDAVSRVTLETQP